jgi:hypothetical protein
MEVIALTVGRLSGRLVPCIYGFQNVGKQEEIGRAVREWIHR